MNPFAITISIGVAILALWLIWWLRQDDGERPPIIVSNGSVKIAAEPTETPDQNSKKVAKRHLGKLRKRSGTEYRFEHYGYTPRRLEVLVTGTTDGSDGHYEVTGTQTAEIKTSHGSIVFDLHTYDDGTNLRLRFPTRGPRKDGKEHKLILEGPDTLTSIEVPDGGGQRLCPFGPNGRVEIRSREQ